MRRFGGALIRISLYVCAAILAVCAISLCTINVIAGALVDGCAVRM